LPDKNWQIPTLGDAAEKYLKLPKVLAKAVIGRGDIRRGKETDMRFLSVALALAIVTGAAFAQEMRDTGGVRGVGGQGSGRHAAQDSEKQKIDPAKKKAAEDAYRAALKGIPDSKAKVDPWRGVR
jgi:hypothetical protein